MKENEKLVVIGIVVIAAVLLFSQQTQYRIQQHAFVGSGQTRSLGAVTSGCENHQLYSQCPQINPNTAIVSWCINEPELNLYNPSVEVLNIMGRCYYPECAPNDGDLGSGFYMIENTITAGGQSTKIMRKVISSEPGYGIGEDIEASPGMKIGSSEVSIVPKTRVGEWAKGMTGCIKGSLTYQPSTTTTTTTTAMSTTTTMPSATTTTIIYQIPQPPQTDVFIAIQDIIQSIIDFIQHIFQNI